MKETPESIASFVSIYNDVETYPTIASVGEKLELSINYVNKKSSLIRVAQRCGKYKDLPLIISRHTFYKPHSPMSEHQEKYKELTAEECLQELVKIQEQNPEKDITRNFFRNSSPISDAVWNKHFGTFEEFKRQAGLKLSRQQHLHEKHIARHASVDHYRLANEERASYESKYERLSSTRFKTLLVSADLHDIEIDRFFLRVWIDTLKRIQPDNVVFGGDIFDLPEFGKYTVDPREWNVVERIKFAHDEILQPSREAAPNASIDFIEGNHEARLIKHLCDATPALRAVLSDLHGMSVSQLLGLDKFEINYYAKLDLSAFSKSDINKELAKNYKIYYDSFMVHHFPYARKMGVPGVNGHHHSHEVWSEFNHTYKSYEWHQLGCGHKREASYCDGEKWHNGFAIVHIDTHTKTTNIEYVPITDFAVVGGKFYYREVAEAL